MTYRIIEEGDGIVGIVQGATLPELFEHAALAVYDLTAGIDRVRVERDVPVMAVGDTPDALLSDWLSQVLIAAGELGLTVATAAVDRLEMGGVQGAVGGFRRQESTLRFFPTRVELVGTIVSVPDGFWVKLRVT